MAMLRSIKLLIILTGWYVVMRVWTFGKLPYMRPLALSDAFKRTAA